MDCFYQSKRDSGTYNLKAFSAAMRDNIIQRGTYRDMKKVTNREYTFRYRNLEPDQSLEFDQLLEQKVELKNIKREL